MYFLISLQNCVNVTSAALFKPILSFLLLFVFISFNVSHSLTVVQLYLLFSRQKFLIQKPMFRTLNRFEIYANLFAVYFLLLRFSHFKTFLTKDCHYNKKLFRKPLIIKTRNVCSQRWWKLLWLRIVSLQNQTLEVTIFVSWMSMFTQNSMNFSIFKWFNLTALLKVAKQESSSLTIEAFPCLIVDKEILLF